MAVVLRWITAGESHGPALVAVLEGMVAGVEITTKELAAELARRKLGHGRSPRMAFEADELEVIGGIRHGRTQGGPIAVRIGNTEWPKWETVMSADPVDPALIEGRARNAPLTRPRPGHADLAGMTKFGFDDARPVLERASARETAARVALGTVAKAFLAQALDVHVVSHVVAIGAVDAPDDDPVPGPHDQERVDASPVRAFSEATAARMMAEIDAAHDDGDTLGGVIEVVAYGLPVGISFIGRAGSEPTLIKLAYAFERATQVRQVPRFLPSTVIPLGVASSVRGAELAAGTPAPAAAAMATPVAAEGTPTQEPTT